jgi:hypothetical protein
VRFGRALTISEELAAGRKDDRGARADLGATLLRVGRAEAAAGKPAEAKPLLERAVALLGEVTAGGAGEAAWKADLAAGRAELEALASPPPAADAAGAPPGGEAALKAEAAAVRAKLRKQKVRASKPAQKIKIRKRGGGAKHDNQIF